MPAPGGGAMLTISQLASFVGVTVRAVRHYHSRGLLAEPARDASGYRRYDAQAVIDLIRIKTLAEAGVPLSRVSELLQCDDEMFAAAVDTIDRNVEKQIHALKRHRIQVRALAAGESLALPDHIVDYLVGLRAAGIGERTVELSDRMVDFLEGLEPDLQRAAIESSEAAGLDETVIGLLDSQLITPPAWERLTALLEQRFPRSSSEFGSPPEG